MFQLECHQWIIITLLIIFWGIVREAWDCLWMVWKDEIIKFLYFVLNPKCLFWFQSLKYLMVIIQDKETFIHNWGWCIFIMVNFPNQGINWKWFSVKSKRVDKGDFLYDIQKIIQKFQWLYYRSGDIWNLFPDGNINPGS